MDNSVFIRIRIKILEHIYSGLKKIYNENRLLNNCCFKEEEQSAGKILFCINMRKNLKKRN